MAKKKQRLPYRQWSTSKKFLFILGILLALLAIAIFTLRTIHNNQIKADRARFAQASKDVQTVAAKTSATAKPYSSSFGAYCYHRQPQFPPTDLHCRVISTLVYMAGDLNLANQVLSDVQADAPLADKSFTPPGKFGPLFHSATYSQLNVRYFNNLSSSTDIETISRQLGTLKNEISCSEDALYANASSFPPSYMTLKLPTSKTVIVEYSCDGAAKSTYFSLDESQPM